MSSFERYIDWLEEARDDLETAKDLYKLGRYSKACYFAHQAAEKGLKALALKKLHRLERIHSVAELLRRMRSVVDVPEDLVEVGERLDRFYIPTRYPNAWPYGAPHKHYREDDAKQAIEWAEQVMSFVERAIKDPSPGHWVEGLDDVVRELVERLRPLSIVIVGSTARREFVEGASDVDMIVITENEPDRDRRFLLRSVGDTDIEVVVVSLGELLEAIKRGNEFYKQILEGIEVYGDLLQRLRKSAARDSQRRG